MWILIAAVASASLLGSMHCVGMCGPLAIWASGASDSPRGGTARVSRRQMAAATSLYHLGRLFTYALAGLIAGFAGGLVDLGGEVLGVQLFAARVVGTLMMVLGAVRLWTLMGSKQPLFSAQAQSQPSLVNRVLIQLRPYVFRLPVLAKGFVTGLLTAFLPCGWLYLFALVAAGTGSVVSGPVVMIAFWVGTVPALVGLVAGTQFLAFRFRRMVPTVAAVLLIAGGCYTAMGRGFAQLGSLAEIQTQSQLARPKPTTVSATPSSPSSNSTDHQEKLDIVEEMRVLVTTPLPCCAEKSSASALPEGSQR